MALGKPREVKVRVHDGVDIAVALYMPDGQGRFPVLLAPSPYRYDNNALPATPQFLWRETGPIEFYLQHGYVYAHMDVRGCGKSGGEFRLLDRNEQKDLYDVIEWLGHQPGRTARSAASANPISACRNGGWRFRSRRRSPASPRSTG